MRGLLTSFETARTVTRYLAHAFGFEDDDVGNYDGGVVEYSTNGGSTWSDAAPLFTAGMAYFGPISSCCGNPLANRNAFVGESWGYTATQLNLASLSGQQFRGEGQAHHGATAEQRRQLPVVEVARPVAKAAQAGVRADQRSGKVRQHLP